MRGRRGEGRRDCSARKPNQQGHLAVDAQQKVLICFCCLAIAPSNEFLMAMFALSLMFLWQTIKMSLDIVSTTNNENNV